jgi:hypothetical protein
MAPLPAQRQLQPAATVAAKPASITVRPVVTVGGKGYELSRRVLVSLGLIAGLTSSAQAAPVRGDAPPLTAFEVSGPSGARSRRNWTVACFSPNLFADLT